MPQFAVYSKLRADLLKCMLIKATEIEDIEIPALRARFGVLRLFPLPDTSCLYYNVEHFSKKEGISVEQV